MRLFSLAHDKTFNFFALKKLLDQYFTTLGFGLNTQPESTKFNENKVKYRD